MSAAAAPEHSEPMATATVEVAVSADQAYALVSDVVAMAELAAETTGVVWRSGAPGAVGSVFRGSNRNGWRRWSTTCTVAETTPPSRFAYDVAGPAHVPVARWAYDVEPLDGDRCRVTERMWDRRPGWMARAGALVTGVADRATGNREHMEATLAAVKERLERPA